MKNKNLVKRMRRASFDRILGWQPDYKRRFLKQYGYNWKELQKRLVIKHNPW